MLTRRRLNIIYQISFLLAFKIKEIKKKKKYKSTSVQNLIYQNEETLIRNERTKNKTQ